MEILELVSRPENKRDAQWEADFLVQLPKSQLTLTVQEPQLGADGFPYLFATTGPTALEPAARVLEWLSTRGVGLVINAGKKMPDYIFTYGMIWFHRESGKFFGSLQTPTESKLELEQGSAVLAGPPSDAYLPPYVRHVLKHFLKLQQIEAPKILVLSKDRLHYDLCFSLESLGNPPPAEHGDLAEVLGWFLPPHYSIVLISEEGLPAFFPL